MSLNAWTYTSPTYDSSLCGAAEVRTTNLEAATDLRVELLDQALTKLVSTEVGIIQNDMKIASVGVIERLARAPMPLATLCPSLSRIHRTNRQSWVFFHRWSMRWRTTIFASCNTID